MLWHAQNVGDMEPRLSLILILLGYLPINFFEFFLNAT